MGTNVVAKRTCKECGKKYRCKCMLVNGVCTKCIDKE